MYSGSSQLVNSRGNVLRYSPQEISKVERRINQSSLDTLTSVSKVRVRSEGKTGWDSLFSTSILDESAKSDSVLQLLVGARVREH